jgi:hypothetical protein
MEMGKDRKFQQNPKRKIFAETQSDGEKIASPPMRQQIGKQS